MYFLGRPLLYNTCMSHSLKAKCCDDPDRTLLVEAKFGTWSMACEASWPGLLLIR